MCWNTANNVSEQSAVSIFRAV